ncbi:MAG: hypothetical protein DHS20C18_07190 [Saprospiraceae bacterium]|nr:MAG: hypothetical protein DHS20C18_07190 [Saprospiraceae bacterium]
MKRFFFPFVLVMLTLGSFSCSNQSETPDQQLQAAATVPQQAPQPVTPAVQAHPVNVAQQSAIDSPVKWMSFNEAMAASKKTPKKIFIDVYTDWCGWCKVMDRKTFSQTEVAEYMNKHFYNVKLNAEKEGKITFEGKEYALVDGGKRNIHTFAYALLDGRLSYPSYVYLNEDMERIQISKGFKEAAPFMEELKTIVGSGS